MTETAAEWLRKADADIATARRELAVQDEPNFDAVCFHAQQCIEKLMKAGLMQREEATLAFDIASRLRAQLVAMLPTEP